MSIIPPMPFTSPFPESSFVRQIIARMPANAAFPARGPTSNSSENDADLSCHAWNFSSSLSLARQSSNPPAHSPVSTPPGVPSIAGVVPEGHASRNQTGLSLASMRIVSNSNPASLIMTPRRRQ